ncbi:MAG: DUF378 domain-containing protein [Sedimentisphaerales bacterium]|nr:DUF378 domain-containing protein [Sedimentisphaerales bacterium]
MRTGIWKTLDCVSYALIIIGALNWGLVGFFGFNVVAALFGAMTVPARIIYAIVGLAAVYDLLSMPAMVKRWDVHIHRRPAHVQA